MKQNNPYRQTQPSDFTQLLAQLLDAQFKIPGTNIRFGMDFIIGLVPGLGDWLSSMISLYVVNQALMIGAPTSVILRMLFNIGVDQLIGTIPVFGDIFDVFWKANLRNTRLLSQYQAAPIKVQRRSLGLITGVFVAMAFIFSATGYVAFKLMAWLFHSIF